MTEFFPLLQRAALFGMAALGVALLLQWILAPRVPARWRVWVWRVALIQTALALVPFAPIALAVLPARAPVVASQPIETPTVSAPEIAAPIDDAPAVAASQGAPLPPAQIAPPAMTEAPAISAPLARPRFDIKSNWRELAVWIYLAGVAFQVALLLRNIVRVRRALNCCAPLDNAVLRPIAQRLKIRRLPRLLRSASGSPFLVGILRPAIVVPQTLDPAHLEAVFAHELAHHKRRDLTWNALLWALQTALWFHPLSWVSRRFHALEVESACDELTLQLTPIAPKSYGALLIGAESQSSPLTAGVNDNFFALQTRLKRLNRAPMQPRRRAAWLLTAALLLSFAAALPLRLTARAQNEVAAKTRTLDGTVRDYVGNPIVGATVYVMAPLRNGDAPLQSATTDANGGFQLSGITGRPEFLVDAGARGLVHYDSYRELDSPLEVRVAPGARAQLRFVDDNGKPINGLKVSLRRAGPSPNLWANVPKSILNAMRGTTDASGTVNFRALPANFIAQFQLDAEQLVTRRLSQIGIDELVNLDAPQTEKTIVIRKTTVLVGRVTLPDGTVATGSSVTTRRVSAAEARSVSKWVGSAWESYGKPVTVDARGNYRIENLRPGNYQIWFAPGPKNSNGIEFYKEQTLKSPFERVDAVMSRGGLIQGVIVSQQTGKPIKGRALGLRNSQGSYDYATTDARGYFRFRSLAGAQHLWVPAQGMSAPLEDIETAKNQFDFALKVGEKREFKIALPTKPQVAPVSGTVVGPDSKAVAGATVFYRTIAGWGGDLKKSALTDAQGRFVLSAASAGEIVQLFADKGDLTTPYSTIVTPGKTARLQLAHDAWSSIEGRITDEDKRPLAGIAVNLAHFYGRSGISGDRTSTNKNGEFRYARVRPNTSALLDATKAGYTTARTVDFTPLPTGQTRRLELTMQRASQTLSGTVYGTDGQPARGYSVTASGQSQNVRTDGNGRFQIPQVLKGAISVWVVKPGDIDRIEWQPVKATGGDQNVVIRLAQVPRDTREQDARRDEERALKNVVKPETLVGKVAPPIRATRWANNRALSLEKLRGKPVFLLLKQLYGNDGEIRDLARSVGDRVQFIGVQLQVESWDSQLKISAEAAARQMEFPIAVDAAIPARKTRGWQTAQSYGYANYAVIGRDGRVIYAGNDLKRAVETATSE